MSALGAHLALEPAIGRCSCGCGQATSRIQWNRAAKGLRAGEFRRFVRGHSSRTVGAALPGGVLVDEQDRDRVSRLTWRVDKSGYVRTLIHIHGRRSVVQYLHRFIVEAAVGDVVDHINGNKLDNRRANLRIVTHAENMQNRTRLNSNNRSGFRGVSWSNKDKRWIARATISGKVHCVGSFATPSEADSAVRKFRRAFMPGSIEEIL